MGMITVVNKALAGMVGRGTASGIGAFVGLNRSDRHRDKARTRVRMPATLSVDRNRVSGNVDVRSVFGLKLDVPLIVLVGPPVRSGIQAECWVNSLPLLHGGETGSGRRGYRHCDDQPGREANSQSQRSRA